MDSFEYNANPARVVFGSGSIQKLPAEMQRLGVSSPLLLSTPRQLSQTKNLPKILEDAKIKVAGTYTGAKMHNPIHIIEDAMAYQKDLTADCIVSLGGGSVIGLGKGISIRTGLPHICIVTTHSGSEMTMLIGVTQNGQKVVQSDPKILPRTVIYDPDLTLSMPPATTATSGVNAIAHAVESLYAPNTNPILRIFAMEGISALAKSLLVIVETPTDQEARSKALYGGWLCAVTGGTSTMALHHRLCHTIGGSCNLPHAETHTIVLPHAVAYNAPEIPSQMADLASVLPGSNGDAVQGLNMLLEKLKVKRALKDFGMKEEDIDKVTDIVASAQFANPRKLEREKIREVVRRCWAGEPARADL